MYMSAVCILGLHDPRRAHSEKGKQKLTIPKLKQDRCRSLRTERKPQEVLRGLPSLWVHPHWFPIHSQLWVAAQRYGVCWTSMETALRTTPALDCRRRSHSALLGQPQVLMCCCCCRCGPEQFSGLADAEYFSMPQITSSQSLLYRARYYLWFHDSLKGMGPILRIRAPVLLPRF